MSRNSASDQNGIRALTELTDETAEQLADVLIDCVAGGASIGFMASLTPAAAKKFWSDQAGDVASGDRVIFVAQDCEGIVGTVQLVPARYDNQPHRADIAKMLVHRRGRRRGLGERLLLAAETEALARGRTVLVLDTVPDSDAERLYQRLGWQAAGIIPDFALYPDGRMTATCFYYRLLA